ncbi:MAG: amidohydrolase family protein [Pyrinomonadaceae bacterium]
MRKILLTADYVLPITSSPIEKGAVLIEGDKIKAVGRQDEFRFDENFLLNGEVEIKDFGQSVLMPGFVNAHSHLELTIMRNMLGAVEDNFLKWLLTLAKIRRNLSEEEIYFSAILGVVEGIKSGITCFADVGNIGKASFDALKQCNLRGIVYQETNFSPSNMTASLDFEALREKFLALRQEESFLVRVGISPHAPYTVSKKLFEKIAQYSLDESIPVMIHVAESKAELSFLLNGKGVFADLYTKQLKNLGPNSLEFSKGLSWFPPKKRPIDYLKETSILSSKPLLVHCVHVTDEEIASISENKCSIAHCPRSNARFGHGIAPLRKFLDSGVSVGIGTDGAPSCGTLDKSYLQTLNHESAMAWP